MDIQQPTVELVPKVLSPVSGCCYCHFQESKVIFKRLSNNGGRRVQDSKSCFDPLSLFVFFKGLFGEKRFPWSRESIKSNQTCQSLPGMIPFHRMQLPSINSARRYRTSYLLLPVSFECSLITSVFQTRNQKLGEVSCLHAEEAVKPDHPAHHPF